MLAVIAIVTAVTVPNFVGSIRGSRLRAATRSVVMAGRYARSMAVLRQVDMALVIDLEKGAIAVRTTAAPPADSADDDRSPSAGEGTVLMGANTPPADDAMGVGGAAAPGDQDELSRSLDRVTVEFVRISESTDEEEGVGDITAGVATIVYRNNGRCTPYTVRLVDEDEIGVTITVDALASATTERDGS